MAVEIFVTRWFGRWARKEGLTDKDLCGAIAEIEQGLVDAVLGGHLVKKRIALRGRGKSGSVRTIIAYQAGDRAFCLYGFAKNQKDNVRSDELAALKKLSNELLKLDQRKLRDALDAGALKEIVR